MRSDKRTVKKRARILSFLYMHMDPFNFLFVKYRPFNCFVLSE